jgi:heme exporter protein D
MEGDTWRELLQNALGPSAITLIVLAMLKFIQSMRENRTSLRSSYDAREQRRYERMERRLNAMVSLAERHLPWDVEMKQTQMETQSAVHRLERSQGLPITDFSPIRPAPPLFPAEHFPNGHDEEDH